MSEYRQRLATILVACFMLFGVLFVVLHVVSPEFAAGSGGLAGAVFGGITVMLGAVLAKDIVDRSAPERGDAQPPPSAPPQSESTPRGAE